MTTTTHVYKAGDRVAIDARVRDENDKIIAIHGDTGTIIRLLGGDEDDLITDGEPGPFYAVRCDHLSERDLYVCEASITPAAQGRHNMINDCPICEIYTDGQGHDDHAGWRELAEPDEVTAVTIVLAEHESAHQAYEAAGDALAAINARAAAIVGPLHKRGGRILRQRRSRRRP